MHVDKHVTGSHAQEGGGQVLPAVSYFSVYFQPKVFLILILTFVFEFPEHSSVKI